MCNYDISFPQTDSHSTVCLRSNSRTQTRPYSTIAPHQSSSYPEYLSPTWDEDTQRAVVWTRLREHCKLANRSLASINKRYKALHQEQQTQVESRHEPLSRDTPCTHSAACTTNAAPSTSATPPTNSLAPAPAPGPSAPHPNKCKHVVVEILVYLLCRR